MKRKYRERKYYCGEYLEVDIYPVYTETKKRGKRSNPTSEIQQKLNKRHAEGRLRRLLHTNFTENDLFVTLTFDDDHLPKTVEDCQREVQNFLRRLKRRYAKIEVELKYIYVIEYGEQYHRLHAHLVLSAGMSRDELTALWGNGSVSCECLRFEIDGLSSLAAYLTKGGDDETDRATFKRWSGSRNLDKPEIEERDGRMPHRKMVGFCENGGDYDYLETEYCGYDVVPFSIDISEDLYGGYYLSAMLKKSHTREYFWSGFCDLEF